MAFSIDAAIVHLNKRKETFDNEIQSALRAGLELERLTPPKLSTGDYTFPNISVNDVWQPYACNWLPNNTEVLSGITVTQQTFMANLQWGCVDFEEMYTEFGLMQKWASHNTEPQAQTFPQYVYETAYMPKMMEQLNTISFQGGVGVKGLLPVLTDLVAQNKVVPIPTATVTAANAITVLTDFVRAIPQLERVAGGEIYCSYAVYDLAKQAWIAQYGSSFMVAGAMGMNPELRLPEFNNVKLTPFLGMGNSQRLIFKQKEYQPIAWLVNPTFKGAYPQGIWFQEVKNGIVGFRLEMSRGYGFRYADRTFVNNKA